MIYFLSSAWPFTLKWQRVELAGGRGGGAELYVIDKARSLVNSEGPAFCSPKSIPLIRRVISSYLGSVFPILSSSFQMIGVSKTFYVALESNFPFRVPSTTQGWLQIHSGDRESEKRHLPSRLWSYSKRQHRGLDPRCNYLPGSWRNECRLYFYSLGNLRTQVIKRVNETVCIKLDRRLLFLALTHLQDCSQHRVLQLQLLQAASANLLQTTWGSTSEQGPQPA